MKNLFTAIIHKEDDLYVAECPEVGTASQGEYCDFLDLGWLVIFQQIKKSFSFAVDMTGENHYIIDRRKNRYRSLKMTVAEVTKVGKNRTVKLPGDFFPGENKVYINKIGNSVVLIPYHDSWRSLFDSLTEFSDDFMEDREQPKEQTRENIF